MAEPRPLIAGNWKMNGLKGAVAEFEAIAAGHDGAKADAAICPPATLVAQFAGKPGMVAVGGQDCHADAAGAFTGDISAEMLKDAGASLVIVGHSERRQYHGESDAAVRAKAKAAHRAGLVPIVCVGETKDERVAGKAVAVVTAQVDASVPEDIGAALVVAYEPVWAIGTGLTPTNGDIAEIHAAIRARLVARFGAAGEGIRILYGGSVKPANAGEILSLANVNGALVGGASLKAKDFLGILAACG